MDLENIQGLFNPDPIFGNPNDISTSALDQDLDSGAVNVEVYPLGFLRTAGNIQADGIPHCFYPYLSKINKAVRKPQHSRPRPFANQEEEEEEEEDEEDGEDNDNISDSRSADVDDANPSSSQKVVRPISSQFYNYITHRVATRGGRHDAQQGTVTAAVSGAYAKSAKDNATATRKKSYCDDALPSDRFHKRISRDHCPTCCRAEFVYSIDVRAFPPFQPCPPFHPSSFIPSLVHPFSLSLTGPYIITSSSLSWKLGRRPPYASRSRTTSSSSSQRHVLSVLLLHFPTHTRAGFPRLVQVGIVPNHSSHRRALQKRDEDRARPSLAFPLQNRAHRFAGEALVLLSHRKHGCLRNKPHAPPRAQQIGHP